MSKKEGVNFMEVFTYLRRTVPTKVRKVRGRNAVYFKGDKMLETLLASPYYYDASAAAGQRDPNAFLTNEDDAIHFCQE